MIDYLNVADSPLLKERGFSRHPLLFEMFRKKSAVAEF